ncbi:restriction endonuclease subunit S [Vibrio lentus]|nr:MULTISPECIES: restriction endonuclease subunit S [Vibrio]MCC4820190.1 restriction endonuclease subunit S [Vibrio lentus]PMN37690.1 restriction endonuclease subunit S [Vibrio sp. 10N.261.45.E2]PMN60860.1 restriction endonuclease subunit S [Vibrio sp. 10N.261.45.E11]TCW17092.1 type I restriction enzyme S subunit [Vibrio crassostreae]
MVPNVENWELKLFKNILKLDRGSSPRPIINFMTDADDGVNWIKIGDTKKGELYINSTKERITHEGAKKSRKVSKGEVIVSNSMSYGQPYILNIDGYIHDGWFVIRNYEQHFEKNFLLQILGSELIQRQYKRLAAGGVVSNISSDLVYAVKVGLPPLREQRKIAKILSTWDKAIATTEKLIDTSKQQKKVLMQKLLTGKKRLVNPDTGEAFEGKWERYSMSELVFIDRKSLGKKTPDDFEFQYISLSDVDVGSISKELEVHKFVSAPSRARRVIQVGDILLSTVRPNLKGFAKVTDKYADKIASTGFAVLTPKSQVSSDYIYQYVFSVHITGQIDSLVVGSNYPAINSSDVSGLKVYCPTFEEQQRIASVLTVADREIEVLEVKLAHFKQEKKALMQQLLTGKRRVKVDDMEVA